MKALAGAWLPSPSQLPDLYGIAEAHLSPVWHHRIATGRGGTTPVVPQEAM